MVKKEQGNERSVGGGRREKQGEGYERDGWRKRKRIVERGKGGNGRGKCRAEGEYTKGNGKGQVEVLRKEELGEGEDKSERREGGRFEEGKRG